MSIPSVASSVSMSSSDEIINVFTPILKPNEELLEYPFSFIDDHDYITKDFCKGLPDEEPLDCGNFPKNITEYYWIHEGENDEEPWMCLCKLTNDCYVFYSASCDYTGFDCQGGMKMIISKDKERLFNMGLTYRQRKIIISEIKYKKQKERDFNRTAIIDEKLILKGNSCYNTQVKDIEDAVTVFANNLLNSISNNCYCKLWYTWNMCIYNMDS
jgi:hypothetical protein